MYIIFFDFFNGLFTFCILYETECLVMWWKMLHHFAYMQRNKPTKRAIVLFMVSSCGSATSVCCMCLSIEFYLFTFAVLIVWCGPYLFVLFFIAFI